MATKSEIWNAREELEDCLIVLKHYSTIKISKEDLKVGLGLQEACLADLAMNKIAHILPILKDHCIDEDDYDFAIELERSMNESYTSFIIKAMMEVEQGIFTDIPGTEHYLNIEDTMDSLENWINEQHHKSSQQSLDNKTVESDKKSYEYKEKAMDAAFDFLKEKEVLNVTKATFLKAVETADFSALRKADGTMKTYLDYSLSILKFFVEQSDVWYRAAAASIGKVPSDCTKHTNDNLQEFGNGLKTSIKKVLRTT